VIITLGGGGWGIQHVPFAGNILFSLICRQQGTKKKHTLHSRTSSRIFVAYIEKTSQFYTHFESDLESIFAAYGLTLKSVRKSEKPDGSTCNWLRVKN
jgi:hypothetical protein